MKVAFDIGSHDGKDSIRFLKEGYKVYAFEPIRYIHKNFEPLLKDKNFTFIPIGIDNEPGVKPFHILSRLSSMYEFNKEVSDNWFPGEELETKVETHNTFFITLYDFCKFTGIDRIDYLHCDTQGNDLNVLKSLKTKINIVQQGVCEAAGESNLYKSNNSKKDIEEYLVNNGFKIDKIVVRREDQNEFDIHFSKV